jgi:hypothetical protein
MDAEPVLRYWTLQSPTGAVATCVLVRTPNGLEVRCDWAGDGAQARVARAAAIAAVSDALDLAEAWKAAYVAEGWMARAAAQRRQDGR